MRQKYFPCYACTGLRITRIVECEEVDVLGISSNCERGSLLLYKGLADAESSITYC